MDKEKEKKPSLLFKIVRWFVWLFYPKIKIEGIENIPKRNYPKNKPEGADRI